MQAIQAFDKAISEYNSKNTFDYEKTCWEIFMRTMIQF